MEGAAAARTAAVGLTVKECGASRKGAGRRLVPPGTRVIARVGRVWSGRAGAKRNLSAYPMYFSIPVSRAWTCGVLVMFIACGAEALRAQMVWSDPPPDEATLLERLVVEGRGADLVGTATGASQGLVGARELEARPWLRRGELLEVIPGVVITQHSGGGKANQYFLRGFNLDHGTDFSVSVDGLPVNMRTHAHGQGYSDLNYVIPELVRQVEYGKGPFDAAVGDFSAAGAAEFRLFDVMPRGIASATVGENGFARLVVADSVSAGGGTTTYAVEATHDDGPWHVEEDFRRFNGFVRHHWRAGAGEFRVTGMAYRGTWTATDQIPLRAVETGELDRFGTVDPTAGGESERISVAFDATIAGAGGTTRLNAYALRYRLDLYSNFTYFLDDPDDGDQFNQRDRRVVLGGAASHAWTGPRGTTTAGVQVRADFIDEVGLHRTAQRRRLATVREDEVSEASAGVFLKNETRWNAWLRTEAGVRVDGYRFDVESDVAANSGERTAAIATPKVAVVLGPWAGTEVYANFGDAFHSNDARGTTIRVDPVTGEVAEAVDPLVRSRGAEIGVRATPAKGWVSSLAVWALTLDSELVFVGDAGGTEAAGATRRVGLEWANFYRVTPWLTLDADLAVTRARYRDAGDEDRIANSIPRVVTAGATFQAKSGWFGSVRLRYFSAQPLIEDGSEWAPSSLTSNLRLGWRGKAWEVSAEVLNVFDRENHDIAYFYESRLPGEAAEGVADLHFHPAEPRTLRVSVTRSF
jgi:Outer membrane receptor proteins, mostly Fe transport